MKILRRLACKFDFDQSERKSSQVNASARKSWPNGVASRPKFSTCGYLRLRLARALDRVKSIKSPMAVKGLIDLFLFNLNAEIVPCILSFRKSRHKPNLENTSKYVFPPIWGKKWRRSEHAHASYPGLFFRPPGFSPYTAREKGEFRDWTIKGGDP